MSYGDGAGADMRDISVNETDQSIEFENALIKMQGDPKRHYQI